MGETTFLPIFKWYFLEGSDPSRINFKNSRSEWDKIHISDIPDEVTDKIKITMLKLRFKASKTFDNANDRWSSDYCYHEAFIDLDLGSGKTKDNWSYNTKGSPSWDKMFYIEKDNQYYWLPADEAKQLFKKGFKLEVTHHPVLNIGFDLFAIQSWLNNQ